MLIALLEWHDSHPLKYVMHSLLRSLQKIARQQVSEEARSGVSMSLNMDLGSWTIFSLLDREFTAQIRLACVFGNLGNEALIVTRDDEVSCANTATCMIVTK